jgi:hypothetical protein
MWFIPLKLTMSLSVKNEIINKISWYRVKKLFNINIFFSFSYKDRIKIYIKLGGTEIFFFYHMWVNRPYIHFLLLWSFFARIIISPISNYFLLRFWHFFCYFRIDYRPTKGKRLIRLMYRGMCTDQVLMHK